MIRPAGWYFRPMRRPGLLLCVLLVLALILFIAHLVLGTVSISVDAVWDALFSRGGEPVTRTIVRSVRLPQAGTALVAGAGLAASGLMMQTLFRNPLAGPSVLGLSSGAGLAVAVVMLAWPMVAWTSVPPDAAVEIAAMLGAAGVLVVVLLADRRVGDGITLLIIGLMIGYLCSALVSVLEVVSAAQSVKGYVLWGMGSFAGIPPERMPWLVWPVLLGCALALWLVKPLNALLLGEDQARSLGTSVVSVRRWIILVAALLAGTITAFCGPIAFLGLATPHVARGLLRRSDHVWLMPITLLTGAVLALGCGLIVRLPGEANALPLNAVTSLLGAPVVVWVLLKGQRWSRAT